MSENDSVVAGPQSKRIWIAVAILVGLLTVAYVGTAFAFSRSIPFGTTLNGENISGQNATKVAEQIAANPSQYLPETVEFELAGQSIVGAPADFGISLDVAAMSDALKINAWNPVELVKQLTTGNAITPIYAINNNFEQLLAAQTIDFVTPPQNATLDFEVNPPVLLPGAVGKGIDTAVVRTELARALSENPGQARVTVPIEYVVVQPEITDAEINALVEDQLSQILAAQIIVTTAEGLSDSYSPAELRKSLVVTVKSGKPVLEISAEKIAVYRNPAFVAQSEPVQDATWDVSSGTPVLVPAKAGYGISNQSLADTIESVWLKAKGERQVQVEFGVIEPEFTTAEAEALGIVELVSSYTQNFEYLPYRVTNIGQAAEYIDGTLLLPGEEFSMNDTILERTYANGYVDGYIIAPGGIFKMEPGGGVSAATTTMFNGAWFAGLDFLEWRAHSVYISRYPAGREATVFWGQLDMRFVNSHPTGLFITTYMTNTSMTVKFWGTKQWDEVGSISGPRTNVTKYEKIYSEDPDCSSQTGADGFRITVYRTFVNADLEVKREAFSSSYRPTPQIICSPEPTKKPTPKPTVKPTPSPSPSVTPSPTPTGTAE